MRTSFVAIGNNGCGLLFGRNGLTRLSGQMARFSTLAEAEKALEMYNECWSESSGNRLTKIEEVV